MTHNFPGKIWVMGVKPDPVHSLGTVLTVSVKSQRCRAKRWLACPEKRDRKRLPPMQLRAGKADCNPQEWQQYCGLTSLRYFWVSAHFPSPGTRGLVKHTKRLPAKQDFLFTQSVASIFSCTDQVTFKNLWTTLYSCCLPPYRKQSLFYCSHVIIAIFKWKLQLNSKFFSQMLEC